MPVRGGGVIQGYNTQNLDVFRRPDHRHPADRQGTADHAVVRADLADGQAAAGLITAAPPSTAKEPSAARATGTTARSG